MKHLRYVIILAALFFTIRPICFAGDNALIDSLQRVTTGNYPDSIRLKSFLRLAELTLHMDAELAMDYANSAFDLAHKNIDVVSEGLAYKWLGNAHYFTSDYDKAIDNWTAALRIFTREHLESYAATVLNNLGVVHKKLGESELAMRHYMEALHIRERLGDQVKIAESLLNISSIHKQQLRYNDALEYLEKAKNIFAQKGNQLGLAGAVNNIGLIYEIKDMHAEALESYQFAHRIYEMLGDNWGISKSLNNIGTSHEALGAYEEALQFFRMSLNLKKDLHDRAGQASTLTNLGNCHVHLRNYDSALVFYEQALIYANEVKVLGVQEEAYKGIANTYNLMGRYKEAYTFGARANSIKDSLFNQASQKHIAEMEMRYSLERVKNENRDKDLKLLMQESELEATKDFRNFLIASIILAVVIIILGLIRYREAKNFRKELQRQNQEIAETNEDLMQSRISEEEKEVMLKEIHHRVKNNLQIINSLIRLQSAQVDDEKVTELFLECQNRIIAMALIHEKLYQSEDLANINIREYIEGLLESLISIYQVRISINKSLSIGVDKLSVDTLIPVGLIVNELISNSLKHAFVGRKSGTISLTLDPLEDGTYVLRVADNGIGLPEGFSMENTNTLGIDLIQTLVSQLDGTISHKEVNGTEFEVIFGNPDSPPRALKRGKESLST